MTSTAVLFDIQRHAGDDGPGIRTVVFFKGCPLACAWCQNPEGIDFGVGPAARAGPVGFRIGLEELLERVLIDKPFFTATGGGVTLSGGEPTAQMAFISRFLERLREEDVRTAIETCGDFNYERFRASVLPSLDLIYFDLKLLDPAAHRRHTGRTNARILENLHRLVREPAVRDTAVALEVRVPLVPGITDSGDNLAAIGGFLRRQGIGHCTLMRYNPLWLDKLERLGMEARYGERHYMTPEREAECVRAFARAA